MQTTTELYKQILSDDRHDTEIKVTIAGVEYAQTNIIELSTSGGIFSSFSVGNCVSREIDLSVVPIGVIPKMAEIKIYVRLTLGALASEWIPKGVFYIDTRSVDEITGVMAIHGYDAMLKTEQLWAGTVGTTQQAAVNNIASRIGVALDDRTNINTSYRVSSDDDYTMREILGYIGACHGGNWIITDAGELRLITLGSEPEATNYLVYDRTGQALLFGEVRILV